MDETKTPYLGKSDIAAAWRHYRGYHRQILAAGAATAVGTFAELIVLAILATLTSLIGTGEDVFSRQGPVRLDHPVHRPAAADRRRLDPGPRRLSAARHAHRGEPGVDLRGPHPCPVDVGLPRGLVAGPVASSARTSCRRSPTPRCSTVGSASRRWRRRWVTSPARSSCWPVPSRRRWSPPLIAIVVSGVLRASALQPHGAPVEGRVGQRHQGVARVRRYARGDGRSLPARSDCSASRSRSATRLQGLSTTLRRLRRREQILIGTAPTIFETAALLLVLSGFAALYALNLGQQHALRRAAAGAAPGLAVRPVGAVGLPPGAELAAVPRSHRRPRGRAARGQTARRARRDSSASPPCSCADVSYSYDGEHEALRACLAVDRARGHGRGHRTERQRQVDARRAAPRPPSADGRARCRSTRPTSATSIRRRGTGCRAWCPRTLA